MDEQSLWQGLERVVEMISEIGKLASQIHQLRHDIMNNHSLTDVERENLFIYMRDDAERGLETMKIVRNTLEHMIGKVKEIKK